MPAGSSVPLVSSRGSRTSVAARLFAPYGESYNNVGIAGDLNFTGDNQDLVVGTFDTPNRELNPNQGRWISPDPAHSAWNAYSYSTNPLAEIDPSGLNAFNGIYDPLNVAQNYGGDGGQGPLATPGSLVQLDSDSSVWSLWSFDFGMEGIHSPSMEVSTALGIPEAYGSITELWGGPVMSAGVSNFMDAPAGGTWAYTGMGTGLDGGPWTFTLNPADVYLPPWRDPFRNNPKYCSNCGSVIHGASQVSNAALVATGAVATVVDPSSDGQRGGRDIQQGRHRRRFDRHAINGDLRKYC